MAAPLFSVIIATRDRPILFQRALSSVIAQHSASFEIIVVNDGSSDEHWSAYGDIQGQTTLISQVLTLPRRPHGHGPSYAANTGALVARGRYLAFLDDDDSWIDSDHLARAATLLNAEPKIDAYFTAQTALSADGTIHDDLWLNPLTKLLGLEETDTAYPVTIDDLLKTRGFCHINTLIIKRMLYHSIDGMDESIRWEGDHDLNIRLWNAASDMRFCPRVTARHYIPDPNDSTNVTTSIGAISKLLSQKRVFDKLLASDMDKRLVAYARRHSLFVLKKLALVCYAQGYDMAANSFAAQATTLTGLKWWGVRLAVSLKIWPRRRHK